MLGRSYLALDLSSAPLLGRGGRRGHPTANVSIVKYKGFRYRSRGPRIVSPYRNILALGGRFIGPRGRNVQTGGNEEGALFGSHQ